MSKLYIDEDGKTSVYEILEEEVTIGRGAANGVQVRDPRASKHHALIRQVGGRLKLVDLETKNGTRVNGAYRNQAWLGQGDTLTIGGVVIRLDLEGAAVAPPPTAPGAAVPAVAVAPPVQAAPVAPAGLVAEPVAKPAVPAVPAVPAKPAAPARQAPQRAGSRPAGPVRRAPQRAPAAPARGSGRRGGGRDEEPYDDEEDARPVRKTGVDSSVILLVGGLAVVAFVLIMFLAMQSGLSPNKEVWLKANEIAGPPRNDYAAAIKYAEKHADPGGDDWSRLRDDIAKWKKFADDAVNRKRDEEAAEYLNVNITRKTRTKGFSPINALPNSEIAELLKDFLVRYEGSTSADWILGGRVGEPWETYQHILQRYASGDADINSILERARTKSNSLAAGKRYGAAVQVYENLEVTQKVLLTPDLYGTLVQTTTDRKSELLREARESFNRDLASARSIARGGNKRKGRAHLQVMIDTYGIPALIQEAQDEMLTMR